MPEATPDANSSIQPSPLCWPLPVQLTFQENPVSGINPGNTLPGAGVGRAGWGIYGLRAASAEVCADMALVLGHRSARGKLLTWQSTDCASGQCPDGHPGETPAPSGPVCSFWVKKKGICALCYRPRALSPSVRGHSEGQLLGVPRGGGQGKAGESALCAC